MPETFATENEYGSGVVLSWASILEDNTREQAEMISRGKITHGYVALMPDAHLGQGACIGTAIVTQRGLYPNAVGADIGCGMIAVKTDLEAGALDQRARVSLRNELELRIPAGVGQGHRETAAEFDDFLHDHGWAPSIESGELHTALPRRFVRQLPSEKAAGQFGTLGAGNHFVEYLEGDDGAVWIVLHSGSRGIGNAIAQLHQESARAYCADPTNAVARGERPEPIDLEHRDLAFLQQGDPRFDAYVADMLWAQAYAYASVEKMMDEALEALYNEAGGWELQRINCHHNYSELINEDAILWLTRKGAIAAHIGELGVIPGSMGTDIYVVEGAGSVEAYFTAPHGAGRVSSRGRPAKVRQDGTVRKATGAYARFSVDHFVELMNERGVVWQEADAAKLLDETPECYKDIATVMADSADLAVPVAVLHQIVNYKGVEKSR